MRERVRGKKVLITGATGFIGSHLVEKLANLGAELTLVAPSPGWRPLVVDLAQQERVRFIRRRIYWEPSSPDQLVSDFLGCEYVIHLAYLRPREKTSVLNIAEDIRLNLLGTARLIQQLPDSVAKICFASSVMVYGNNPPRPVSESDCVCPESTYAIGKLAAENYLQEYGHKSGVPVTILRLATVYGPFETVPRAIPNFVRRVLSGNPPIINGSGTDVRDYVHVSDVVEATLLALSYENDSPQIFNVGTGIGYSTNEIAEKVVRLSGKAVNPIHKNTKHVPSQIVCDITRAETVLGYKPTVPIDEGITEEINFLSKNPEYWRMP